MYLTICEPITNQEINTEAKEGFLIGICFNKINAVWVKILGQQREGTVSRSKGITVS